MADGASGEGSKLWGGRFKSDVNAVMEKFNASIDFDKKLWKADLIGSQAYAKALCKAGLLTREESSTIVEGLEQISDEWRAGKFVIRDSDEDIHTANERRLKEIVGSLGGKLHTGRSRNDQVATDTRLWLREKIDETQSLVLDVIKVLVQRAESEIDVLMPGYTHLQRAQPIRWSHFLLSHAFFLRSDLQRLTSLRERVNVSPLGSGALSGNPFCVDREALSVEMGFDGVTPNSMCAVADRDYIAEFLFFATLASSHLSRMAEDLILYSTKEFGFVRISDEFSTGSSLMPQKKNPDGLELVRGKSGRIFGDLSGFLMVLKGLPSTYNKDLQEDKEPLFDAVETLGGCLQIIAGVFRTLEIDSDKMRSSLSPDMLATDIAYYLVRKGMPFREAHLSAGKVVALGEEKKMEITNLASADLRTVRFFVQFVGTFSPEWLLSSTEDTIHAKMSLDDAIRTKTETEEGAMFLHPSNRARGPSLNGRDTLRG